MSELGARLYAIVQEYAAIGAHHRTGTPEDARTLDWFENRVRALGASMERQPWSFDRYDAEWTVSVDGANVAALPLFYEATGVSESTTPLVAEVSAVPFGTFPQWSTIVADARSAGAHLAVRATRSPSGGLAVPNRSPAQPGSGLPALLVAGALSERLQKAPVRARLAARVVGGRTSNIIGCQGSARALLASDGDALRPPLARAPPHRRRPPRRGPTRRCRATRQENHSRDHT